MCSKLLCVFDGRYISKTVQLTQNIYKRRSLQSIFTNSYSLPIGMLTNSYTYCIVPRVCLAIKRSRDCHNSPPFEAPQITIMYLIEYTIYAKLFCCSYMSIMRRKASSHVNKPLEIPKGILTVIFYTHLIEDDDDCLLLLKEARYILPVYY